MNCDDAYNLACRLEPRFHDRLACIRHRRGLGPGATVASAYALRPEARLTVRSELQSLGIWTGSWPNVIVFSDPASVELVAHEICHLLPVFDCLPDTGGNDEPAHLGAELVALSRHEARPIPQDVLLAQHGPSFLRLLIHVWARLDSLGVQVRPAHLGGTEGLSRDISDFRSYLSFELQKFRQLSLDDISRIPVDECFSEVWRSRVIPFCEVTND